MPASSFAPVLARVLALMLALNLAPAAAWALSGRVSRVTDGDTVWIQPAGAPRVKLRVQGIDAPERCQPWGAEASQALREQVLGRDVVVAEQGRDGWGRLLGDLWLAERDVGAWMVREGHAWSYRGRGGHGPYDDLEAAARRAGRGLFSQRDPMRPGIFRRLHGPCEAGE